jgi:hypothetical protein
MSRKPIDIAHVNLRIRESLRKKLAAEAKKHGFSLNGEINKRLEESFEREGLQSIAEIAAGLAETQKLYQSIAKHAAADPLGDTPDMQEAFATASRVIGRLIHDEKLRLTNELIAVCEQGDQDAIKAALARVKQATLKATVYPLQTTREKS